MILILLGCNKLLSISLCAFWHYSLCFHYWCSEHAEKYGYGVVERFVGHGVGTIFHSQPIIYHHSKLLFNDFQCRILFERCLGGYSKWTCFPGYIIGIVSFAVHRSIKVKICYSHQHMVDMSCNLSYLACR